METPGTEAVVATEKKVSIMKPEDYDVSQYSNGAFAESLQRNNKQIRLDRAQSIIEDAFMRFKRKIEDHQMELRKLYRDRDNLLDLSPATTTSLKLASDFNAEDYVNKEIDIAIKIRQLELVLEVAMARFNQLFAQNPKQA